jgi:hypothetical protein
LLCAGDSEGLLKVRFLCPFEFFETLVQGLELLNVCRAGSLKGRVNASFYNMETFGSYGGRGENQIFFLQQPRPRFGKPL